MRIDWTKPIRPVTDLKITSIKSVKVLGFINNNTQVVLVYVSDREYTLVYDVTTNVPWLENVPKQKAKMYWAYFKETARGYTKVRSMDRSKVDLAWIYKGNLKYERISEIQEEEFELLDHVGIG